MPGALAIWLTQPGPRVVATAGGGSSPDQVEDMPKLSDLPTNLVR